MSIDQLHVAIDQLEVIRTQLLKIDPEPGEAAQLNETYRNVVAAQESISMLCRLPDA